MKSNKPAKLRPDVAEVAFRVMQEATGLVPKSLPPGSGEKNPEAVKRGRKGGKKGGKARAKAMTPAERVAIATTAAKSRWAKTPLAD